MGVNIVSAFPWWFFSLDKQNNVCQVTLAAAQVTDFNLWQDHGVIFSVWLDHEMHPDKTDQLTEVLYLLCFVEYVFLIKKYRIKGLFIKKILNFFIHLLY